MLSSKTFWSFFSSQVRLEFFRRNSWWKFVGRGLWSFGRIFRGILKTWLKMTKALSCNSQAYWLTIHPEDRHKNHNQEEEKHTGLQVNDRIIIIAWNSRLYAVKTFFHIKLVPTGRGGLKRKLFSIKNEAFFIEKRFWLKHKIFCIRRMLLMVK